ncbi:MAG: nucleotide 5'-monophosphate nucleosidase PpnN [Arenicella sp.]
MVDAVIRPKGHLDLLSQHEIELLKQSNSNQFDIVFRNCALAVLSCGTEEDDSHALLRNNPDFSIRLLRSSRGISLELKNAPEAAFVDGVIIAGLRDHLFSVLRDIVYIHHQLPNWEHRGLSTTDMVFNILRNARALKPRKKPNLVVCWGGHAISEHEYDYSKKVGYRLGLRGMDICTGCGAGAMKGPMKGAFIAHGKQRNNQGRYIGISEPGIIASEAPNAIVNHLNILPDIEKRLEAFVRMAHGIVVFPGGAGTAEEILYLLGILMHPDNVDVPVPLVFTGPSSAKDYFATMDEFIRSTIGEQASQFYEIIIDDPVAVGQYMKSRMQDILKNRSQSEDAFYFNWLLTISNDFQQPFEPSHENMASLNLHKDQDANELAANLRRAFSGIVAGNVKENTIKAIQEHGTFKLRGDAEIMQRLDALLHDFIQQKRMKVSGKYTPCYEIIQ